MKTEMFGHRRFLSPVETAAELPKTDAKSGFLCLVTSEASIYELVDGAWRKWVSEKGPAAPDP